MTLALGNSLVLSYGFFLGTKIYTSKENNDSDGLCAKAQRLHGNYKNYYLFR